MNRPRLAASLLLAAAPLALAACISVEVVNPPKEEKVFVCHKGKTLEIARAALEAHLKHGDTEGACP